MSSNLSKELRKKHDKRNIPVKKGDKVRIMVGEFKKKTGKIDSVDLKKLKLTIEGIYRTKKDGSKVGVYFDPSNIQIQELNLDDKKRVNALSRKGGIATGSKSKVVEKAEENKTKFKAKPLPKAVKDSESKDSENSKIGGDKK